MRNYYVIRFTRRSGQVSPPKVNFTSAVSALRRNGDGCKKAATAVEGYEKREIDRCLRRKSSATNYRLDDEGLILKEQGEDPRLTRISKTTEQPARFPARSKVPPEGNGARKSTGERMP